MVSTNTVALGNRPAITSKMRFTSASLRVYLKTGNMTNSEGFFA